MTRLAKVAAVALATSVAAAACATTRAPVATTVTSVGVEFVLVDRAATTVAVAGSFNAWSVSSHRLVRTGPPGRWATVVRLPPGDHHFMFVVDGARWVVPAMASDYIDDGFGSANAVVVVPKER